MNPIQQAAAAYKGKVNDALAAARANGSMLRSRVTRELVREQAAESNVTNILAAIVAGLQDGMNDPALRPFCEMAKEEIEDTMLRISRRHPCRRKEG